MESCFVVSFSRCGEGILDICFRCKYASSKIVSMLVCNNKLLVKQMQLCSDRSGVEKTPKHLNFRRKITDI